MRRKDKEITDINEKMDIVAKCKICRLGLCENNQPYVVPLNYGYVFENDKLTLFFHGAAEGRKACFEIDCDTSLVEGEKPCDYGYEFRSVIGFGKVIFLETFEEKTFGLNCLMRHQTGKDTEYAFVENELRNVVVFKMLVEEFTGKGK